MVKKDNYDSSSIQVLKGLEAVRVRPAMYVGDTDKKGLHHLVWEVLDNAIDEAMAGFCTQVNINLLSDGETISIEDNGRGIPTDIHPEYEAEQKSALEVVLTVLHAGGKFDNNNYAGGSGGLHGVGVSCVNALSDKLIAEVWRDGGAYRQEFCRGIPTTKCERLGDSHKKGTAITFHSDPEIFTAGTKFDEDVIIKKLREMAFLNAGLKLVYTNKKSKRTETFQFDGGISDYITYQTKAKGGHYPNTPFYYRGQSGNVNVQIAFQFTEDDSEVMLGYANNIFTPDGGTHISGFKTAFTRLVNQFGKTLGVIKTNDTNLSGDDIREGITTIISVRIPQPQFEGQTKAKLGSVEADGAVQSILGEGLTEYFEKNPAIAKQIIERAIISQKAREAAKRSSEQIKRKNIFGKGSGLPGKLYDCNSENRDETELMICEGDSAAGAAKMGRDIRIQAVLPIRGKIINAEKNDIVNLQKNTEIQALTKAIGTGTTINGENEFKLEDRRYNKIIFMSVSAKEPVLICDKNNQTYFTYVGEFIDKCLVNDLDYTDYKIACFDLETHKTLFSPIKNVVRHKNNDKMYYINTLYNRNINVTGGHSVFVYENGEIILKTGNTIKIGDIIVAPRKIPQVKNEKPQQLDLISMFINANLTDKLYIKDVGVTNLKSQQINDKMYTEKRTSIDADNRLKLKNKRYSIGKTLKQVAEDVGVKQACTICDWENGKGMPIYSNFNKYLKSIQYEDFNDYSLVDSKLTCWINHPTNTKNTLYRKLSNYGKMSEFDNINVGLLSENAIIVPQHYRERVLRRYQPVDDNLMYFLGWYMAEGSLSRGQVSLSLGYADNYVVEKLKKVIYELWGENARTNSYDKNPNTYKLYFNNIVVSNLIKALGLHSKANNKIIPDIIFNVSDELKYKFIEGYFLGDGTVSAVNLSFTTTSTYIKDRLLYLLGQLGIVSTCSERNPQPSILKNGQKINGKCKIYNICICGKENIRNCSPIWKDHKNGNRLNEYINNGRKSCNIKYVNISDDLIGLPVNKIIESNNEENVYDFSVNKNENFICGVGGICAHNTDADVDGSHIATLLLTFFYKFMRPLITEGHVFLACPPLFKAEIGSKKSYFWSIEEMTAFTQKHGNKVKITRYKGLGEMNADELAETTMEQSTRRLIRVTVDDLAEADRMLSVLMGKSVVERKAFIVERSRKALEELEGVE